MAAKKIAKKTALKASSRVLADNLPRETLEESERVSKIIHDNYAGKEADWNDIAVGLELAASAAQDDHLLVAGVGLRDRHHDAGSHGQRADSHVGHREPDHHSHRLHGIDSSDPAHVGRDAQKHL